MVNRDEQRRTIFRMLYEYSVANPTIDLGALITEVNGGKEVVKYLPDDILYKKLLYRINKLKQKETA